MRGDDVTAAGERFEHEYTRRLFEQIYNQDDDGGEETWDRNP